MHDSADAVGINRVEHHRIKVLCPAKLNLGLEVLHRRADGYHEISSVMQAINLHDELELEVIGPPDGETPELEFSGPFAAEVPVEGNSVLTAWAVGGGVHLPRLRARLVKNIPAGSGLGGGSSDAAAMLVALRELRRLPDHTDPAIPDDAALAMQALRVGSDVPFFLAGGCQLASGRGEALEPIKHNLPLHCVVTVPHFFSGSGIAYAALGRMETPRSPMLMHQLASALREGDFSVLRLACVNDFEPYLRDHFPQYDGWLEKLVTNGAACAAATGSGSGFFGLFESAEDAATALASLREYDVFRYSGVHRAIQH